ncbi:MAG: S8 family serine peptidase [Acidobacteriia bacterium]|nr:S8 family serine peptidase [Terriglobia bacterium]
MRFNAKRYVWLPLFMLLCWIVFPQGFFGRSASPATTAQFQAVASNLFILRTPAATRDTVCDKNGLQVIRGVDTPGHDVFLVSGPAGSDPATLEDHVKADDSVQSFEQVGGVFVPEALAGASLSQSTVAFLDALSNTSTTSFSGDIVRTSYVNQAAATIINLTSAQGMASGSGTIAIIDTGVDPNHPALRRWLVPGFDFVHNVAGVASEWSDLAQSTVAFLDQSTVAFLDQTNSAVLNQSTVAFLDQSTVAFLDANKLPAAFGHGTMVAGIVHLVAPTAKIMPLKAFQADGSSNTFDIIRAIYYAVDNGANVINMSFSLAGSSQEFVRAINYATDHGVICIASAGNNGTDDLRYPAALRNVIGVASTSNLDVRSTFSNFGSGLITLAAPGEGIITTYPGGHYAAAWGTSFSAPFVAGAPGLLLQFDPKTDFFGGVDALSHAKELTSDLGYGRLDLYQALTSRLKALRQAKF